RRRVEWVRGEQQHVPRMAARAGADLVHSLASTAPLWGRVPRVTTIHDLNYLKVPEAHFGLRALGMRVLVPAAARRSRRVIVDAASTREDLHAELGVPRGKVDVVPLAATPPEGVVPTPEPALRERLGLGTRRVALSPGAKRPHKNLMVVLEALARISPGERPLLVVPGYPTPYEDELRSRARELGVDGDVAFPAWLAADDLEGLYALAELVVLPSRYEGFGLPVLEAMQRGVPVITSDRASLPEVAGDAALLVDPDDAPALAGALRLLLRDEERRASLIAAGREQAARFSWERTAELTAASYRRTLSP
ncbi:MAG: glycosyltransferase family 4 protein, partial [Solirubrobacteraceae bacterium]|nr:glycosyltransferase family 4 protein [Solirubrobacteraceae bacterium]